jgi:hypothetical protein
LRFVRQTEHGIYIDDCTGLHPDIINEYYGTTSARIHRQRGQTGAGHPPEEQVNDIAEQIAEDQDGNVRHDAIPVPRHESPFDSDQTEAVFFDMLNRAHTEGLVPIGYGVTANEMEGGWEQFEMIQTGRRRRNGFSVDIPEDLWLPRARLWVQGLHLMNQILFRQE